MADKRVRDLMLSVEQCATVQDGATIRDALTALRDGRMRSGDDRQPFRTVLVLDEKHHVVGKLTYGTVLRRIEPSFLKCGECVALSGGYLAPEVIESLNAWLSGFANDLSLMCIEAAKAKVRDAMIPVSGCVDEDATLPAAIHELVAGDLQIVSVARGGEIVGILRASDVFEEVAGLICSSGK